ncbi:hypothetical protein KC19_5G000900 [Ceratodon purpureus]|uniref:Dynein axonemal intermediate chain 4 n=1 Tax=Ceratodon purpureus TaxID=3225 RepID=A0A8T0HW95_CERPU|nr:hypothetical protein KC19_5G000900 [Ceratodon purpureus]
MAENIKHRSSSAGSASKQSQRGSPKRSASAGKSRDATATLRGGAAETKAGMPALPLGQRENNRNSFNAAKARADKEAMAGAATLRTSTQLSSRRQSGSSQISTSTKTSGRPGRGKKKKRGQNDPIQVFNENGKDVTPKPLSSLKPTVLSDKLMSISAQSAEGTEFVHSVPIYSRTGFSVTSTAGELTPETDELGTDFDGLESDGQEFRRSRRLGGSAILETPRHPKRKYAVIPAPIVEVTVPKVLRSLSPSEIELEKPIPIIITESRNCIMLNMRGHNLNETYANYKQVMERNEKYLQLKEAKLGNLDNYTANISQTLFSLLKNKEAQASSLSTQSNSIQVNSWDIADSVAGKVKPDQYQPWKVVQHGSKDHKTTNPTTTVVILPEIFTENDGPNVTPPISPPESRRQSMASRKGSTVGGYSRRPSASVGQQSRRTSLASRRASTSGGMSQGQGLDDVLRLMSPASAVTGAGSAGGSQGGEPVLLEVDISKIPGLLKALEHIERACVLNTYHDRLLDYMNFRAREEEPPPPTPPPELDKDGKPKKKRVVKEEPPPPLDPLAALKEFEEKEEVIPKVILPPLEDSTATVHSIWDFQCNVTEGRNISCMSWNKMNRHLIAVGYGEFDFGKQRDGMIAFWSLKNPRYPHAVLPTHSGVTSVDFATSSPSLLAVGFYSGNVAIYDVRNPRDLEPMVKSSFATGKHADPVWKVQWVDHATEHGEGLVSISTDGRVSQWSIKKDLEFVNLMKLKKVPSQNKGAQPQPFISRRSAGLCFEFSKKDIGIYLVGTEEGPIYKCDRSYNEQYLMTYIGHNGPIYQVRWSPFMESLFLSCSADWTVRLWSEDQTTNMPIADVWWSFTHACVFAMASTDGHMEMWDLHLSVMKPIVAHTLAPDDKSLLSCMMFSEEAPLILLGGSTGVLYILRFDGLLKEETEELELKKLKDALAASVTRHGAV